MTQHSPEYKDPDEALARITLAERTQIISTFWAAPSDAKFTPEIVAIVLDSTLKSLATLRSRGLGPKFLSSGGGKRLFYLKSAVCDWINTRMVSASNCAEARELELELQDAA